MSQSQEMESTQVAGLPVLSQDEIRGLLKSAIEQGGVEALERVVALYERSQAQAAERAYHGAMATFSSQIEPIKKNGCASFAGRSGGQVNYSYAYLEDIARAIRKALGAAGLCYTWDSVVDEDKNRIKVTCTVSHTDGHSKTAQFTCSMETKSASMSKQQEVASALTYGRRQSLIQALGLTTCDDDLDGADLDLGGDVITESQALDLDTMLKDAYADRSRFLNWLGVGSLESIPASRFDEAVRAIQAKAKSL